MLFNSCERFLKTPQITCCAPEGSLSPPEVIITYSFFQPPNRAHMHPVCTPFYMQLRPLIWGFSYELILEWPPKGLIYFWKYARKFCLFLINISGFGAEILSFMREYFQYYGLWYKHRAVKAPIAASFGDRFYFKIAQVFLQAF